MTEVRNVQNVPGGVVGYQLVPIGDAEGGKVTRTEVREEVSGGSGGVALGVAPVVTGAGRVTTTEVREVSGQRGGVAVEVPVVPVVTGARRQVVRTQSVSGGRRVAVVPPVAGVRRQVVTSRVDQLGGGGIQGYQLVPIGDAENAEKVTRTEVREEVSGGQGGVVVQPVVQPVVTGGRRQVVTRTESVSGQGGVVVQPVVTGGRRQVVTRTEFHSGQGGVSGYQLIPLGEAGGKTTRTEVREEVSNRGVAVGVAPAVSGVRREVVTERRTFAQRRPAVFGTKTVVDSSSDSASVGEDEGVHPAPEPYSFSYAVNGEEGYPIHTREETGMINFYIV